MTLIEKAKAWIQENRLNVYDIAVMTEGGIEHAYCQPCNACNAIYSVTKLFIVTMIGILYDEGRLGLDDKLTGLLADSLDFEYEPVWDAVTVRHALTHSMGIEHGMIDIDRDDTSLYETDHYLRYIFSCPPSKTPGTYRLYTDVPHYLLSLVIEAVTGKRADEAITERILNPLHFASTSWARCPRNHTIGSSGAYMRARDIVKLAWLYQNFGIYQGNRILSASWVRLAEKEQYDLYPCSLGFWGKGGMNGQMTAFNRERNVSIAWLGYEPKPKTDQLLSWFCAELDAQQQ